MNTEVQLDGGGRKYSRIQRPVDVEADGNGARVRSCKRRRNKIQQTGGWPLGWLGNKRTRYRANKRISLGKFGMKKFEGKQMEVQDCMLRPYMDRHMSPKDELFSITGCGASEMVIQWFIDLIPSVKDKVRKSGFEEFILCLQPATIDGPLIQALATKWWDTTHTFHFSHIGELTMTPKDFSAITGLPVSGIPLIVKHGTYHDKKLLNHLLGEAVCKWKNKRVPVLWLYEVYKTVECTCEADEDIVVRAFLLALLGATIFARPSLDVDLDLLGLMLDVRRIRRYNWGAAALALLYNQMDDISRRNTYCFGGFWLAWEVWAREYFNILLLIIRPTCQRDFPASKNWNLAQKPYEDLILRLEYYTIKLENSLMHNINWNPWGHESILPWYVAVSIDASTKRILLISPTGAAWYLAERVLIQSFGIHLHYIPRDPPVCMLQRRTLLIPRTRVAVTGKCAHSFIHIVHKCGQCFEWQSHGIDKLDSVVQVPVATASKLLHVIGGLQILLMEGLKNAEDKLRETAFTIEGLRDELALETTPVTDAVGNNNN